MLAREWSRSSSPKQSSSMSFSSPSACASDGSWCPPISVSSIDRLNLMNFNFLLHRVSSDSHSSVSSVLGWCTFYERRLFALVQLKNIFVSNAKQNTWPHDHRVSWLGKKIVLNITVSFLFLLTFKRAKWTEKWKSTLSTSELEDQKMFIFFALFIIWRYLPYTEKSETNSLIRQWSIAIYLSMFTSTTK